MTTNITPREALEQIKTISIWSKNYYNSDDNIDNVLEKLKRIEDIATQALASQENRRRDIEIQIEINAMKVLKELGEFGFNEYLKNGNFILDKYKKLKQLHSQQKTFTMAEIKEKFNERIEKAKNESYSPALQLADLLAEFEKAVE